MEYLKLDVTTNNIMNHFADRELFGTGYAEAENHVVYAENLYRQIGTLVLSKNGELSYCRHTQYHPEDWTTYNKEGLIVVPKECMADGKYRMIPLSGVTSSAGTMGNYTQMPWGPSGDTSGAHRETAVPTFDNTPGGTIGYSSSGYIPSDRYSGITEEKIISSGYTRSGITNNYTKETETGTTYLHWAGLYCNDPRLGYNTRTGTTQSDANYANIPSPYNLLGQPNPDFKQRALAWIDGKLDTDILVARYPTVEHAPALACHNFPNFTGSIYSAGTWYLPSVGELAYIAPRFMLINKALSAVGGKTLPTTNVLWSSTDYSANNAWCVTTYYVPYSTKTNGRYVVPFAKL